jgi:DHA1 family inner membrane transport protein
VGFDFQFDQTADGRRLKLLSSPSASRAPTLAAAVAVSAFNAGIAAGSALAGRALDSSLGAIGPAVVGAIMVALGLIPLAALARLGVGRR